MPRPAHWPMQRPMFRTPVIVGSVLFCGLGHAFAQPVEEVVVRGHLAPSPGAKAYAQTILDRDDLAAAAPRLDDLLRQVPGFGLFRRTSSRDAHPTTQGAALRGIGPNGAGRTLVLLDGVPQNDPFGGWVYWSALPADDMAAVTVLRGGGAGAWGNSALAGVVRFETKVHGKPGGTARLEGGNDDTWDLYGRATVVSGPWGFTLSGNRFETDGHYGLPPSQRGAVDVPLASESTWGRAELAHESTDGRRWSLSFHVADEARINGTALAVNSTRSYDGALRYVAPRADGGGLEATLYVVDRTFENVFTSVADDRLSETPALDQFDVPARAAGGNVIWRRPWGPATVELGGDVRWAEGATHERFLYQADAFRRLRQAGGEQLAAGVFAEATVEFAAATRLTGGVRLDYLSDFHGSRREVNTDTGAVLVDERFGPRSRAVVNGRLGLSHDFDEALSGRLAVYTGFRQPTINELYRPFRVRNDITEANPALKDERLVGLDGGLTWRPHEALTLSAGFFWTQLYDGIANVLITATPGLHPDFGVFVPAGGSLSQRRNLDRVRTQGIELEAEWQAHKYLRLTAAYLLTDATVASARDDPALVGTRPPQTARHRGSMAALWTPVDALELSALVRGESRQFDDAANTRTLSGYVTADVSARWRFHPHVALTAAVENVTNATIETALSADGLLTVGTPRLWRLGLEAAF